MVGNDVIDLGDSETRSGACHPRFDARVFADAERTQLAASASPARLRWVLWAAKEAAFKVAKKRAPATVFSPSRFVVSLTSASHAHVVHEASSFSVELDVAERHVHAIASDGKQPGERIVAAVERLAWGSAICPGDAVRALAIQTLGPLLGTNPGELAIVRDRRIPLLRRAGEPVAGDLSLSHHGRFVAFACSLHESAVLRGAA